MRGGTGQKFLATACLLALLLAFAFSWYSFQAPTPSSEDSGKPYNHARAFAMVEELAAAPHGIGSARHSELRDYLKEELTAFGFDVRIQRKLLSRKYQGHQVAYYLQNIIAEKKGTGNKEKVIGLMAHYDSQPHTPGAADDCAGVAAIVEAGRVLAQEHLEHDLAIIITDGEEGGLWGADAFQYDPLLKRIGLLVNFEARGNRGVVSTFEMFGNIDWMIPEYAKALDHPFANSVSYEVYQRMPNKTDFTITREQEIPGFNVALIGGHAAYHSMIDNPENLDKGSLEHMLEYATMLPLHFDKLNLEQAFPPVQNNMLFFNPVGYFFLAVPIWVLLPVLVFVTICFFIGFLWQIKDRKFTLTNFVASLILWLVFLAFSMGLTWGICVLLKFLNPSFAHYLMGGIYPLEWHALGFSFLVLALFVAFSSLFVKRYKAPACASAGIFLCLIIAAPLYFFVPGASYLLIYPLLWASFIYLINVFLDGLGHKKSTLFAAVNFLGALPIILFMIPIISLLHDSFGLSMAFLPVFLSSLLLIMLFPFFTLIIGQIGRLTFGLSLIASLAFFVGASYYFAPSEEFPLQSSMIYFEDADEDSAWWGSEFADTDFWTENYFQELVDKPKDLEYLNDMQLLSDAPVLDAVEPIIEVIKDTIIDGQRFVETKIQLDSSASSLGIKAAKGVSYQLRLPGLSDQIGGGNDFLELMGMPDDRTFIATWTSNNTSNIKLDLYVQKIGLPTEILETPMPPSIIPGTGWKSHLTILKKQFTL